MELAIRIQAGSQIQAIEVDEVLVNDLWPFKPEGEIVQDVQDAVLSGLVLKRLTVASETLPEAALAVKDHITIVE